MTNNKENFIQKKEKEFTQQMVAVTSKATKKYGLKLNKEGHAVDCEADAFRHAYMQCYLAYRFGNFVAKELGNRHEKGNDPNVRLDTNMDLWNNQIGREIAEKIKKEYGNNIAPDLFERIATEEIIYKIKKGELITNPYTDKRKYSNMKTERLKDTDRVFYEGEYFDKMDEEERKRYSEHYTNYKNQHKKGFPTKEELDRRVARGELIYVEEYRRSDGTKVSGYYRSYPE